MAQRHKHVFGIALCSLNRGDTERAERLGRIAVELAPEVPQTWLMLGQSLHMQGLREIHLHRRGELLCEARANYSKAVDLAHRQGNEFIEAASHLNRGVARSLMSDRAADDDFRRALQLRPKDADGLRQFAGHLATTGRIDEAIDAARAAVGIQPGDDTESLLALVLSLRNQGNDRQEVTDISMNIARRGPGPKLEESLERAISGLSHFNRFAEADALLDAVPAGRISDVLAKSLRGHLRLSQGDRDAAPAQCAEPAKRSPTRRRSPICGSWPRCFCGSVWMQMRYRY